MNKYTRTMRKFIQTWGLGMLILATVVGFTSCSKDDDPADNNLFIGKYEGKIAFNDLKDDTKDVASADGTVTVTKTGNTYNFAFGNSIPNLNGVDFEEKESESVLKAEVTGNFPGSPLVLSYHLVIVDELIQSLKVKG